MKKFYLKIWLLALMATFAAIPAAAAESLDYLLKTKEEKDLAIACNNGDGKYSACTRLVEILSKKCDSGDYESCGAVGMIFTDLGQYEFSSAPLIKACEANIMSYCSYLAINDILFTGNLERAAKVFDKICKQEISEDKKLACNIKKEIEGCSKDTKCDPLMKAKEIIKGL